MYRFGDVQYEGQFVAGVDETEAGSAAQGVHGGLGDAVHALGGCGDRLVDGVTRVECAGGVDAPVPGDADACGLSAIALFDPTAFPSEKLVPSETIDIFLRKAHAVHLARDFQAGAPVGPFCGLRFHEGRGAIEGSTTGIEAHAMLTHPDDSRPAVPEDAHRLVGDPGAGTQQQGSDGGGGDMDNAVGVLSGDGVVLAVQGAAFEVDEGDSITHASEFAR